MTKAQLRYQRCDAAGKCYTCGDPAASGRHRCASCLRKQTIAQARCVARRREETQAEIERLRRAG